MLKNRANGFDFGYNLFPLLGFEDLVRISLARTPYLPPQEHLVVAAALVRGRAELEEKHWTAFLPLFYIIG